MTIAYLPQGSAGVPTAFPPIRLDDPLSAAVIDFATSGNHDLIAGIAGQIIRIYSIYFIVADPGNGVTLKDGNSTPFTGAMPFNPGCGMVLDFRSIPYFVCAAGNAFVMQTSAAVQVSGRVEYVQQ